MEKAGGGGPWGVIFFSNIGVTTGWHGVKGPPFHPLNFGVHIWMGEGSNFSDRGGYRHPVNRRTFNNYDIKVNSFENCFWATFSSTFIYSTLSSMNILILFLREYFNPVFNRAGKKWFWLWFQTRLKDQIIFTSRSMLIWSEIFEKEYNFGMKKKRWF